MHLLQVRWQRLILATVACVIRPLMAVAADDPALTRNQMEKFLLTAEVVSSRQVTPGITHPWRLTLSNGEVTHDASFQSAYGNNKNYRNNIAGYVLAEMLGLEDMMPVYVEREWHGQWGSYSWWLPVQMNEEERLKRQVKAPDSEAWNRQLDKIRVLDALVDEPDDLKDLLIGNDWKLYRIDFSRGFTLASNLRNPQHMVRCDRNLFKKLKDLNGHKLKQKTWGYLSKSQVQAIMVRRDKIVTHFSDLIAEKGENVVLY